MNQSINLSGISASFGKLFGRYHMLIFIILTSVGIGVALVTVISIVSLSDSQGVAPAAASAEFDKETIDRLNKLDEPVESSEIDMSKYPMRTNPFVDK